MQSVVATVAPIFGLIALGFVLARTGYVSEETGRGVTEFVYSVAIPALLFRLFQEVPTLDPALLPLLVSYYGATALTWLLATVLTPTLLRRPATHAPAISMAAGFGNVVMLGLPLALDRFGTDAVTPLGFIVALTPPLIWFAGTLQVEWADRRAVGMDWSAVARELALTLLRNPIITAVVAGAVWWSTGLGLHPIVDRMLEMLGQTAVPGALIALGLGLTAFRLQGQAGTVALICVLGLVLRPALAWLLAFEVLTVPPVWAGVAVLLAACAPGANPFLFASKYNTAVGSISGAVALGTALNAVTVFVIMLLLDMRLGQAMG